MGDETTEKRITFYAPGYVDWNGPTRAQRLAAAAIAVLSALLVVLITRSRAEGLEHVAAPGIGVLLSLAFVIASVSQKRRISLAVWP